MQGILHSFIDIYLAFGRGGLQKAAIPNRIWLWPISATELKQSARRKKDHMFYRFP